LRAEQERRSQAVLDEEHRRLTVTAAKTARLRELRLAREAAISEATARTALREKDMPAMHAPPASSGTQGTVPTAARKAVRTAAARKTSKIPKKRKVGR
jgi:hypothetical protein